MVGNKNKFNEQGVVPVNYTFNELKTDELKMIIKSPYANTKQQPLDQHLFAVGYVAYRLLKTLLPDEDRLAVAVFVAGCLHDIGKLDPEFQAWVSSLNTKQSDLPDDGQHIDKGKFTFDNHARHNEISLLLYQFFDDASYLGNRQLHEFVEHTIYWHHAKPIRKEDYKTYRDIFRKLDKSLGSNKFVDLLKSVGVIVNSVNLLAFTYQKNKTLQINGFRHDDIETETDGFKKLNLPVYKEYETEESIDSYSRSIRQNTKKNITRSCLITADRLVSSLSAEALATHIANRSLHTLLDAITCNEGLLSTQILQCLSGFEQQFPKSERSRKQSEVARKLRDVGHVAVLKGPAGCGKTKISLEWAALTEVKKIIWVCPRVQVCEGLFLDLTSDMYLPNSKIEICTGEYKYIRQNGNKKITPEGSEFSGDLVLTTIDQVINTIITHTNSTSLVAFMNTHVVFDEYHEYIHMPAFNLLFAELVECKKLQGENAKTLLVSATPNDFFIKEFLQIDSDDVISIDSFNNSQYLIKFVAYDETKIDETNPMFQLQPKNSIVISNTATTAQHSFILNQSKEKAVLLHGKFKKLDKLLLFDKVFNSFKQEGSREYELLRSGPIVQASLNITCDHMVTEFTLAENWLQRLGRLDRFGERRMINHYITAIPQTLDRAKGTGACVRFLSSLNCLNSAKAWYQFLQNTITDQPVTISQIYQLYADFYLSTAGRNAVEQDLIAALKNSVQTIADKIHDPFCVPKKKDKDIKKKLKKSSIRGDSRYVQMAVCKVNKYGNIEYINEYACDDKSNTFTMSINEIEGHDPSGEKNLLSFMHQKHHKILTVKMQETFKQAHMSFLLKNQAVEPGHPVYLSYTEEDLALTDDKAHSYAIYYVTGEEQPVGSLSINKLNKVINNEG